MRLGEAQNPRPAEHERDSAQEEPSPRRTRINEAGDAVPGCQDSITRGVQNLQLADVPVPAAQPVHAVRAPPTMLPGDLPNNGHVIEERSYTVLNAARTRSHTKP